MATPLAVNGNDRDQRAGIDQHHTAGHAGQLRRKRRERADHDHRGRGRDRRRTGNNAFATGTLTLKRQAPAGDVLAGAAPFDLTQAE
jgi:hypothetical protein